MTSDEPLPEPSGELGPRGRAFWDAVQSRFEPGLDETELLLETCRTLDLVEDLADALQRDGTTVAGSQGQIRVHPAVGELRSARALLSRLLAQLSIPDEDGGQGLATPIQVRGKRAATRRWDNRPTGTTTSNAAREAAAARWRRGNAGA